MWQFERKQAPMALTRVIMPKTGAEMEEGRIVSWKKNEGERIEKGGILLEIETDKATMEVEAPASGFVLKRLYKEGEVAPATRLIAILGDGDEPRAKRRKARTIPVSEESRPTLNGEFPLTAWENPVGSDEASQSCGTVAMRAVRHDKTPGSWGG